MLRSLRGDRAFGRLRKGRSGGSKHLSVRLRPTSLGVVRIGVVVSRKVGKAVVRNRVRRRLREALLAHLRSERASRWPAAFDVLVIARPSAAEASYAELASGLANALDRALQERPAQREIAS
jgi:ribonuclease P protein component